MKTKLKIAAAVGIALFLIACGGGTAVPKQKKPTGYVTPAPAVTVKANDKCSPKGATVKINGKKYTCKAVGRKDPTLRWKR